MPSYITVILSMIFLVNTFHHLRCQEEQDNLTQKQIQTSLESAFQRLKSEDSGIRKKGMYIIFDLLPSVKNSSKELNNIIESLCHFAETLTKQVPNSAREDEIRTLANVFKAIGPPAQKAVPILLKLFYENKLDEPHCHSHNRIIQALAEIEGDNPREEVILLWRNSLKNYGTSDKAYIELRQLGSKVIPIVQELTTDNSPTARYYSILILSEMEEFNKDVFFTIVYQALTDTDSTVRSCAMSCLGSVDEKYAEIVLPKIYQAISDGESDIRSISIVNATLVLQKVKNKRGEQKFENLVQISVFEKSLKDRDPFVRLDACEALWKLGLLKNLKLKYEVTKALGNLTKDNRQPLRNEALELLQKIE